MCGLCGAAAADERRPLSEVDLAAMREVLHHRGPDDSGAWIAPGIALGSNRLSILDLSERGHMPMRSGDGRFWLAYNGEVYNFRALRRELESRGAQFRSGTDTEVVLEGLAREGPRFMRRANGMFAFALWDERERSLLLMRDRLGVKPLYYAVLGGTLYFASEIKALFRAGVPDEVDSDAWGELFVFRYVAGERTVFRHVKRLLPGHQLEWRRGALSVSRWWRLDEAAAERRQALRREGPAEWFRATFDDAVELRRISDVPLGVMLSGGLDSTAVAAALALQADAPVESFTVTFEERGFDELPLAAITSRLHRLVSHPIRVAPAELPELLREASWLHDEPLVHSNDAHMLALAREAKRRVTVLLSGEGADETLNGYVRYQPLRAKSALGAARVLARRAPLARHGRARKLQRLLRVDRRDAAVFFNACDVLPQDVAALGVAVPGAFEYREQILAEARAAYPGEPLRQAMYLDQHTFLVSLLDRNDRMTMGASIECRVPFLDYRLVEGAAALDTATLLRGRGALSRLLPIAGPSKALLRRSLGDRMPPEVLRGRKWGFGVPWQRYLREVPDLRSLVESLPQAEPARSGLVDARAVSELGRRFLQGDDEALPLVKSLVLASTWHEALRARRNAARGAA